MKWSVVGRDIVQERYVFLSQFLKDCGVENEVSFHAPEREELLGFVEEQQKENQQIRIDAPYCHRIVQESTHLPSMIKTLKTADAYVLISREVGKTRENQWWLRNYLYDAILQLAPNHFNDIDLKSPVLIAGSGAAAMTFLAAFSRLGFQRFSLTDLYIESAKKMVHDYQRRFFGLDIEIVASDSLTTLPGHFQVLLNTTPNVESNTILTDLYFFNYMKDHGIVIDLTMNPIETPLLKEATSVQTRTISGDLIAAKVDWLWMQSCGLLDKVTEDMTFDKFHAKLREFLLQNQERDCQAPPEEESVLV